jgi:hypothetical protein
VLGGWVYENMGPATLWTGCLILGTVLAVGYLAMSRAVASRLHHAPPAA